MIDVARVELCCQGSYGEIGFIVLLVLLAEGNAEQTLEVTWPGLIHGACKASDDFYRHFLKVITSLCQWNCLSGPLTSIQLLVEASKQCEPSDIPASSLHITDPVVDWQAAASITYISNTQRQGSYFQGSRTLHASYTVGGNSRLDPFLIQGAQLYSLSLLTPLCDCELGRIACDSPTEKEGKHPPHSTFTEMLPGFVLRHGQGGIFFLFYLFLFWGHTGNNLRKPIKMKKHKEK